MARPSQPTVRPATLPPPAVRLARVAGEAHPFLLESSLRSDGLGRFSILGHSPFLVFRSKGPRVTIRTADGVRQLEGDPFEAVASLLEEYRRAPGDGPLPFTGGAVGYFGYDLNRALEPRIPDRARDEHGLPDIILAFHDRLEVWDHDAGCSYTVEPASPCPPVSPEAAPRGDRAAEGLASPAGPAGLESNFTRASYLDAVRQVKEHIRQGDIYQANLSQRFRVATPLEPVALYDRLRRASPAPFSAYLDGGGFQVLSSSPERFLRVGPDGRRVETRPIKGTRPRGRSEEEDARLAEELLTAEKDAAELAMIVDVERNDLGRVSEFGSVQVTHPKALRVLPNVLHLEATVESRLREGTGVVDLLRASFPGGSITGAPKIRAMEILEELEPTRRGVYCGAIGYLGLDGACDLNIAIRTLVLDGGVATFQVGGGIVWDSDPEAEYQETLDKARGMLTALGLDAPGAGEG